MKRFGSFVIIFARHTVATLCALSLFKTFNIDVIVSILWTATAVRGVVLLYELALFCVIPANSDRPQNTAAQRCGSVRAGV